MQFEIFIHLQYLVIKNTQRNLLESNIYQNQSDQYIQLSLLSLKNQPKNDFPQQFDTKLVCLCKI